MRAKTQSADASSQGKAPKIKRAGRGAQRPKQPGAQQGAGRRVALRSLSVLEQLAAGGGGGGGGGDWEAAEQLGGALLPLLPGAGASAAVGGQRRVPPRLLLSALLAGARSATWRPVTTVIMHVRRCLGASSKQ